MPRHTTCMEKSEFEISDFISAVSDGVGFYLYRLPSDNAVHISLLDKVYTLDTFKGLQGFVTAPFSPDSQLLIFDSDAEVVVPTSQLRQKNSASCNFDLEADKAEYFSALSSLIPYLNERGGKTVIARKIPGDVSIHPVEVFMRLCEAYPEAMVYCWKYPGERTAWVGATPEVLLAAQRDTICSMSLAGTRPAFTQGDWDTKNTEEQAIVTRYILNTFTDYGLHAIPEETFTLQAGPVEHICTPVKALSSDADFIKMARKLAPTPAVSGYPQKEALDDISRCETFDRECYGGFFGPWTRNESAKFYVTLRCVKYLDIISPESNYRVELFAGGGITRDSNPDTEWKETCLKASTLIKVITQQ